MEKKLVLISLSILMSCSKPIGLKDFSANGASAVTLINLKESNTKYKSADNCKYMGPAKIDGVGFQQDFRAQEFYLKKKIFSYGANLGVIKDYTDRVAFVELYFCSALYK